MAQVARIPIDTRLDVNQTGLRTSAEVEALIGKMDALVTTRLHGLVLAIKRGVPPLVIDPIAGGAKVTRQARTLNWPIIFDPETLDEPRLNEALDFCLSGEGRAQAALCRDHAVSLLERTRADFVAAAAVLAGDS